jgi:integrase
MLRSDDAYRAWRRKVFADAVTKAKLPPMRPYDLRHSFASLLIAEDGRCSRS